MSTWQRYHRQRISAALEHVRYCGILPFAQPREISASSDAFEQLRVDALGAMVTVSFCGVKVSWIIVTALLCLFKALAVVRGIIIMMHRMTPAVMVTRMQVPADAMATRSTGSSECRN